MGCLKKLSQINHVFMKILEFAMNCFMAAIPLLFVINIILRGCFKTSLLGAEEIIVLLSVWIYFIGAAFGSYEDRHVSGDLIKTLMKTRRAKAIHRIWIYTLSTLISGGVTALAVRWIEFQTKIKAVTDVLAMPKLFMYYAAVVGFVLMTIYFFIHLCKAIYVLITNRPVKEVP